MAAAPGVLDPADLQSRFGQVFGLEVRIAIAVFAAVVVALAVALIASIFRQQPSTKSKYTVIELLFAGAVAGVAAFLITTSIDANNRHAAAAAAKHPPVRVQVTAFRWCWRFQYESAPVTVTGTCTGGNDPKLVVPTGVPVRIDLTSADVVHSMWVPHLRFKTAAFPDFVNSFVMVVNDPGHWPGYCAEFCGTYHYRMRFTLDAVSPQQYSSWAAHGGSSTL
ncbi:MAG: cytochrome c oxidase subunit II [Acidimicrobiaceae bacterium]|nr:cytochrome c oxidase subunit II [Acidimicrobiaceae bacterium]